MSRPRHPSALAFIAAGVVALLFLAHYGFQDARHSRWGLSRNKALRPPRPPDLGRYKDTRILSSNEFPIDSPDRRVIIIGDIHGMKKSFDKLLEKVAYNDRHDVLVHTGDILAKGHHVGSMQTIKFMTTHNITGVRGNHDQEIIEWRSWIHWIHGLLGGKEWLSDLQSKWLVAKTKGHKLKKWVHHQRQKSTGQDAVWWSQIPETWTPFGDHYRIAHELTEEEYSYLISLPLKLHIPSAHAFIVHAGLLPSDVRYDYDDNKRQPLARVPSTPTNPPPRNSSLNGEGIQALRYLQETALLRQIPQNTDPWANLNVRSILKNKELSRDAKVGKLWMTDWNRQMSMCSGFDEQLDLSQTGSGQRYRKDKSLPCYPLSVIYGHTASRGLDLNRWTFGLDSGCVYGRELSAMILGSDLSLDKRWEEEADDENLDDVGDDEKDSPDDVDELKKASDHLRKNGAQIVRFGEHGKALIVYVKCSW